MSELRQRQLLHARLSKGGYHYAYTILDGEAVIGCKDIYRKSRDEPENVSYQLGDEVFATAQEFRAAYERQKVAA